MERVGKVLTVQIMQDHGDQLYTIYMFYTVRQPCKGSSLTSPCAARAAGGTAREGSGQRALRWDLRYCRIDIPYLFLNTIPRFDVSG